MSYQSLIPLIKKTGSSLTPEKFHERINIVFHDFESAHYDSLHKDMWDSLQEQINLLVNDSIKHEKPTKSLSMLDVGCGTGLSTKLMLESPLKSNISEITLLDTSPKMLEQAEAKAKTWNTPYHLINGNISVVTKIYDIIIISSVLHHIPDLKAFLSHISKALNPNGILLHLQDPNLDYLNDPDYIERKNAYKKIGKESDSNKGLKSIIPKSLFRWIKRLLNRKDYIDHINDQLIAEKSIKKRMSSDEIWSVTDIHVETEEETKGISLIFLKEQLQNFKLINARSYAFYGFLKSDLVPSYRDKEQQFIDANQMNGRNISCVWVKNA